LAVAPALLHEPNIVIRQFVAEDVEVEERRLHDAVAAMQQGIDRLVDATSELGSGEHRDILEAYRMFATDRGWLARITEAVRSGLTAEAAVQKVRDETRSRLMQVADPYLRERLYDLEDLANRLQHHLVGPSDAAGQGVSGTVVPGEGPAEFILVAEAMGPAELLDYSQRHIKGLVLEEGSPTMHVAIVARALDIPVVGRVAGATRYIEQGDSIVVDGDNGSVLIRPRADIQQSVEEAVAARTRRRAYYETSRDLPAVTSDGVEITLLLNAGLLLDVAQIEATGAAGIGLFRTEIQLLARNTFPKGAEQTNFYRRAYEQAGERPIVFRTLDIGGDKVLPYLPKAAEDNPAMGWRAIRIGLDRPAMLRHQLRALLRAAAGRDLCVKFPMISEVAEFEAAKRLLDKERARIRPIMARSRVRSVSASCSKCRRCCGSFRRCCGGSIFCRSARMIWRSSSSPATAAIRSWPSAMTCCRRRCWRCCVIWSAPAPTPASRSASAARWRATRSKQWC